MQIGYCFDDAATGMPISFAACQTPPVIIEEFEIDPGSGGVDFWFYDVPRRSVPASREEMREGGGCKIWHAGSDGTVPAGERR